MIARRAAAIQVSMVQMQSSMAGAGVGIFGPPAIALQKIVDKMVDTGWISKSAYFWIPQWGSRTEGSTLSVRFLRVRLERSLLYGFVRIC